MIFAGICRAIIFSKMVMTLEELGRSESGIGVNLRNLAVIQMRKPEANEFLGDQWSPKNPEAISKPGSLANFNAANNRGGEGQPSILIFRARSRQFLRAEHHRRASMFSRREGVSRKIAVSKAADCPRRFQSVC